MTGYTFSRRHLRGEAEIANEGANCYSEHDPTIVGHEEKPVVYQYQLPDLVCSRLTL